MGRGEFAIVVSAPVRLVVRSMTDLLMRTALVHVRLNDGDLIRSFVFRTILSANLSHLSPAALAAELAAPDAAASVRRPVSANAVAHSLGLPYETVRSRVLSLVKAGWCLRKRGGLIVPPSLADRPEHQAAVLAIHSAFLDAVRMLKRINFDFAALAASAALPPLDGEVTPGPPPPALVVHLLMNLQLRHMETLVPMFGDLTRGFVWAGVLQANVRNLLVQPEAAWAYASQDTPPPDELRMPVSIRALAQSLGMPYETVRRHVATLLAEGRLVRIGARGVVAPSAAVSEDRLGRGNALLMMRFTRLIAELDRFGFDYDNPR